MSYVHPHVERVEWPTVARSPLPVESSKPPLQGSRLAHLHGPARIRLKEAALLGARQAEFWESHTRALADFKHARQQALHYPSSQQPSPRPSSSTARTPRASSARQHRPAAAHNSPFSAPTIQARAALQGKVDDAHRRLNAIMSRLEQTTTDQAAARQSACIGAISAEITSARGSPRVAVGSPRTHPLSNRATMLPVPLDSTATLHGMDMGVRRPESPRARPESPRARPASPRAALVDAPSTPAPRPLPTPPAPRLRPGVTPEELRRAQNLLRDRITDRHSNLHRAFRSADRDASGYISRDELIALVGRLNLGFAVREPVLDTLIDLMDVENDLEDDLDEGPTDISYREFARALTSADVMNMPTFAPTGRRAPEISDEARRMVRRGVRPDDLRRAQAVIKRMILTKFSQVRQLARRMQSADCAYACTAHTEGGCALLDS